MQLIQRSPKLPSDSRTSPHVQFGPAAEQRACQAMTPVICPASVGCHLDRRALYGSSVLQCFRNKKSLGEWTLVRLPRRRHMVPAGDIPVLQQSGNRSGTSVVDARCFQECCHRCGVPRLSTGGYVSQHSYETNLRLGVEDENEDEPCHAGSLPAAFPRLGWRHLRRVNQLLLQSSTACPL